MSDIADLERRITSALERISISVGGLAGAGTQDNTQVDALKGELAEERAVTAQLEERVRAIKEKQETNVRDLQQRLAELTARTTEQETRMHRLRQINTQLRESNDALRAANSAGVGDAHLINKAMLAELEALRALRETEQGEVAALLSELKPLVGGAA